MSTANRIIKNTTWLYAKMCITMFVTLYTTRLVLQALGVEDYGIYNIVGGAIAMLGFLNIALANATQRFLNYTEGESNPLKKKTIFNVSIILHIAIAIITGIILIILGFFLFNGFLNIPHSKIKSAIIVYISLILSSFFTITSVPYDAVIISHENMKYFAIIGLIVCFLKLIIAYICLLVPDNKLVLYGVFMILVPLVSWLATRFYCKRNYTECSVNRKYYNKEIAKEIITYSGWNLLTSLSTFSAAYGLGIIINKFFGVVLNAAQGIANQVSGALMTFSENAMKAVNPIMVKSYGAQDTERTRYLALFGCRLSFSIYTFFAIPTIVLAQPILSLWLTEIPVYAVIFCQLQVVRIMIEMMFNSLYSAIYATGKIKFYAISKGIINISPLIIVPFTLYYDMNPVWIYVVWILTWSVGGGILALYCCKKLINLNYNVFNKQVLLPSIITITSYMLPYIICRLYFPTNSMNIKIISLSLGLGLFLYSTWKLMINKNERKSLTSIVKKLIHQ